MLLACDQLHDITCKEIDSSRSYSATRSCYFSFQVNGGWSDWGSCNPLTGKKRKRKLCDNGGASCPDSSTDEDNCPGTGY